jgi:hypothetical protein
MKNYDPSSSSPSSKLVPRRSGIPATMATTTTIMRRSFNHYQVAVAFLLGILFGSNMKGSIQLVQNCSCPSLAGGKSDGSMDQFAILPENTNFNNNINQKKTKYDMSTIKGKSTNNNGNSNSNTTTAQLSPTKQQKAKFTSINSLPVSQIRKTEETPGDTKETTMHQTDTNNDSVRTTSTTTTTTTSLTPQKDTMKVPIMNSKVVESIQAAAAQNDDNDIDWSDLMFHMHGHDDDAIVVESHKLVFFPIAKNGSTEWKIL